MQCLKWKLTSPRTDACLLLLMAWVFMDLGAATIPTNRLAGIAIALPGLACLIGSLLLARQAWRSPPTNIQ